MSHSNFPTIIAESLDKPAQDSIHGMMTSEPYVRLIKSLEAKRDLLTCQSSINAIKAGMTSNAQSDAAEDLREAFRIQTCLDVLAEAAKEGFFKPITVEH